MLFCVALRLARCSEAPEVVGADCSRALDDCSPSLPPTNHLPLSEQEVDSVCRAYKLGMECVDAWSDRCLSQDSRRLAEKHTRGARTLMRFLCHDAGFKREYLQHSNCWAAVSSDWERCFGGLNARAKVHKHGSGLCCARELFQGCVMRASRAKCSRAGAVLLRRMAETLAGVAPAHCPAPPASACPAAADRTAPRAAFAGTIVAVAVALLRLKDVT